MQERGALGRFGKERQDAKMEKAYTKEEAMCDLAERTDELWENEIAKKLVRKCAEARRESTEMRKQMFVEAMRGTEEHDEGCAKSIADLAAEKSREYTSMVYELLVSDK